MLGEFLEKNAPDVSVQVVVKSNEDWGDYIDSVSTYSYIHKHTKKQLFWCRYVDLMASMTGHAPSFTRLRVSILATVLTLSNTSAIGTAGPAFRWSKSTKTTDPRTIWLKLRSL